MPQVRGHRETDTRRSAFETWYAASRSYSETQRKTAVPERTLYTWSEWFSWHARADARDAEAAKIADADAIKRRAEMLKRHRQAGELLTRRGMEFHAKREMTKAADATQAIKSGVEIERTAEGLPAWAAQILAAGESDLERIIADLDARRRAALGDGEGAEGADPGGESEAEE